MNKKQVYERALKAFGKQNQITMVFEEMAELQKELSKHLRDKDNIDEIAEEIADVEIMLEQMKILFDVEDKVGQYKSHKINRLNDRINEHIFRRKAIRVAPIAESPIVDPKAPIEYKPKNKPVVDMGIEVDLNQNTEINQRLIEETEKNLSSGNTVNDLVEEALRKVKQFERNMSQLGAMSNRGLGR